MGSAGKTVVRRKALGFGVLALSAVVAIGVVLAKGPGSAAAQSRAVAATTAGVTITSGACTGGGTTFCFTPESLTVAPGTVVTWTNMSSAMHTVTSCTASACPGAPANTGTDTFNVSIGSLNGSTGSFTFMNPGTYTYYCMIHGYTEMHGKVTVTGTPPTPTPTPTPIVSPPKIKSFSPTSGPPGTTVTISGGHLKPASNVSFNGTSATIKSDAGRKIVVLVPTGATTGHITVTTPGGTATSAGTFTVT